MEKAVRLDILGTNTAAERLYTRCGFRFVQAKQKAKGRGYGRQLVQLVENWAREAGYRKLYLETHTNLSAAMKLYEKLGFHQIEKPAAVVHSTMDHFYIREL